MTSSNANVISVAYQYDFQNRLKSMNSGAVTLMYDGDGNRVSKTVGSAATQYLADDLSPTGYAQVVEELTGTTLTRCYTYGLQRISQTQLLNSAWPTSFYGYDGFGSVRQLTDSTGAVTDTCDYDAWGNAVSVTGATPNVYRYRGEQYDADLNLYYFRARYFNPLMGRFLSRDPAEGKTADSRTLHRYLYAAGDPVDLIDPSGRSLWDETLLVGTFLTKYELPALIVSAAMRICPAWAASSFWLKLANIPDKLLGNDNPLEELEGYIEEFCKQMGY